MMWTVIATCFALFVASARAQPAECAAMDMFYLQTQNVDIVVAINNGSCYENIGDPDNWPVVGILPRVEAAYGYGLVLAGDEKLQNCQMISGVALLEPATGKPYFGRLARFLEVYEDFLPTGGDATRLRSTCYALAKDSDADHVVSWSCLGGPMHGISRFSMAQPASAWHSPLHAWQSPFQHGTGSHEFVFYTRALTCGACTEQICCPALLLLQPDFVVSTANPATCSEACADYWLCPGTRTMMDGRTGELVNYTSTVEDYLVIALVVDSGLM